MKKHMQTLLVFAVFIVLFAWYAWANLTGNDDQKALFGDSYWVLPLLGGLIGVGAARKWGGLKSVFGKAVTFLSIGLLAQVLGQVIYTYYARVEHIEAPYPSAGDIGFFGAVLAYIAGAYYLSKTVGVRMLLAKPVSKVVAVVVPLILVGTSYAVFLTGYDYQASSPLATMLDFGYPLGQAIFVAIAVIAYILSNNMLGGVMRPRILLVLGALVAQYVADFLFLYQFSREQYKPGEVSDLVYLVAYLVMSLALISLVRTHNAVLEKAKSKAVSKESENV